MQFPNPLREVIGNRAEYYDVIRFSCEPFGFVVAIKSSIRHCLSAASQNAYVISVGQLVALHDRPPAGDSRSRTTIKAVNTPLPTFFDAH
jgi:hypothetical protein